MENLRLLLHGFATSATPYNLMMAAFGGVMGILVGAMPGIGSLLGCALLLPLTFRMNPVSAIIMLAGIYYGNMYGGAFSAILLNIPGDSPAIMTAMDGYPLTKKGRPGAALFTANMASFVGGTIGMLILTFMGTTLADIGLKFGPSEMVAVMILSMSSISYLLGDAPSKGLIATMLGIILATIGIDGATGMPRYTFGNFSLLSGLQLVPLVIGAFGFSQVMQLINQKDTDVSELEGKKLRWRDAIITKKEAKECVPTMARSGVVGTVVGILPGSGTAAVLLSGLMMWGLIPGPQLFTEQSDFCWGLISSMYLGNILCLAIAMLTIPLLVKLISVPSRLISPVVVVLCFIGAFSASNQMINVYIMLIGAVLGYLMNKYEYPTSNMLLAFVLTPTIEKNLYRSLMVNNGSWSLYWTKPITVVLLLVTIGLMTAPAIIKRVKKDKKAT